MPLSREEDFFKKYINFTLLTPKLPPLGVEGLQIYKKITFSCLFTLQMLHTKFGKYWPSSSWEEDVNGRRTTEDAQRTTTDAGQSIAIGHLSDSGDLKINMKMLLPKVDNFDEKS